MTAAANAAYLATLGASFSNPITTGLQLANAAVTLAVALDAKRSIKFAISNNTSKKMKLLGSHVDCGKINGTPEEVLPGKSAEGYVSAKYGLFGVKLALIYQWGDDEKEKVCLYLENPVKGGNKSGIKYYWDNV